jgi:hypothetical protein
MVLPFTVNAAGLTRINPPGQSFDYGRQAADYFSRRVAQQDLVFVDMISIDDIIAEMTALGYSTASPMTAEVSLQLGRNLEAHEVWMGTVNSVVAEEPQTQANRGVEFNYNDTRKVKKPVEERGKDGKVKTVYKEVSVTETLTATYNEFNQTATTVVKGTYWTFDVASGERSEAKPYEERRSYTSKWAQYAGGSREAWKNFNGNQQNTMPSVSQRMVGGLQAIGGSLSNSFQAEDKRMALPVIHTKMELKSRVMD